VYLATEAQAPQFWDDGVSASDKWPKLYPPTVWPFARGGQPINSENWEPALPKGSPECLSNPKLPKEVVWGKGLPKTLFPNTWERDTIPPGDQNQLPGLITIRNPGGCADSQTEHLSGINKKSTTDVRPQAPELLPGARNHQRDDG